LKSVSFFSKKGLLKAFIMAREIIFKATWLGFKLIDEICEKICSMARDWVGIDVILDVLRGFSLTDEEAKIIFNFLVKYFLEMDERGEKVKAKEEFYNLYKEGD